MHILTGKPPALLTLSFGSNNLKVHQTFFPPPTQSFNLFYVLDFCQYLSYTFSVIVWIVCVGSWCSSAGD